MNTLTRLAPAMPALDTLSASREREERGSPLQQHLGQLGRHAQHRIVTRIKLGKAALELFGGAALVRFAGVLRPLAPDDARLPRHRPELVELDPLLVTGDRVL